MLTPLNPRASLIAQLRICLRCRRPWFDSWVGKIPWRRDRLPTPVFLGFPGGSDVEESTCNVGDLGSISGLGRSLGEGNGYPLQYSGLENTVHGVGKSRPSAFHFHSPPNPTAQMAATNKETEAGRRCPVQPGVAPGIYVCAQGHRWCRLAAGGPRLCADSVWNGPYRQGLALLLEIPVGLVRPLPCPGNPIPFLLPGPIRKPEGGIPDALTMP